MSQNKYEIQLNKIKQFDYKTTTEQDIKTLIAETEQIEKELMEDKNKLELRIEQIDKEIANKQEELKNKIPNIETTDITQLEELLTNNIEELINSIE